MLVGSSSGGCPTKETILGHKGLMSSPHIYGTVETTRSDGAQPHHHYTLILY